MAWNIKPVYGSLTNLVAAQVIARGSAVRATVDLTTVIGAWVLVKLGRGGATALTNGVDVRFRTVGAEPPAAVGDAHPAGISLLSSTAAATSVTVDADSNSGQTTLNVSTTTGFAAGEVISLQDSGGGVTRLEWARISKITNPGASGELILDAPLTFTHTAAQADTVRNKADVWPSIWLRGGAIWACVVDYGDDAAGESITAQVRYRSYLYDQATEV